MFSLSSIFHMMTLLCMIVGVAGSVEFEINENAPVDCLKKAIAASHRFEIAASNVQLFPAEETGGNAWLSSVSDDVNKLKKGDKRGLRFTYGGGS